MTDPMQAPSHRMRSGPVALQLWTVRDAMASDPDEALRRVRAAGFSAVELAPLPPGLTPERLAEALDGHGLAVASIHGDLPTPDNFPLWARLARECRCPKVIWHGWPRDPRFDSPDGVRSLISACNEAAKVARDNGLRFGMHNHWWEFEPVQGERPIRLLHDSLHPDIFWQLDIYWAQVGGVDPAGAVADLGMRVGSIHWKDGPAIPGEPMTALGRGRIDLPRIARILTHPIDWVVELDECATDPLEAARQGLTFLEGLDVSPRTADWSHSPLTVSVAPPRRA